MNEVTTKTSMLSATIDMGHDGKGEFLRLDFADGRTISLQPRDLTHEIRTMAILHGLKQKLVDAAAISRNTDTGRSATIDDKFNAVDEVFKRLIAGTWNKGAGAGSSAVRGGLLFRALCMLYTEKTPDAIRAFLEKKTPTEKAALRANGKIAAIIVELQKVAPADSTATDAMLDELND